MYEALMTCPPNTAWLVTTGTLTNAALLFTTFPRVVDHLRGLSIMGGAVGSHFTDANLGKPFRDASGQSRERIGNHTPYAEFNIWCDPESAQSIFGNSQLSKKTTLISLDTTHQVFATQSIQDMVRYKGGKAGHPEGGASTRLRSMFYELLTFFAKTYAEVFGLTDGPPLHDPVAVAVLLAELDGEKSRIDFNDNGGERFRVDVELTEPELGRTNVMAVSEGVRIPRSLDADRFWRILNECLERTDGQVGRIPYPA
jgi:uridine nucleosidase